MAERSDPGILKDLIEMCRDEEQTLRFVADHLHDTDLKTMFVDLADQRATFAAELAPHAQRLGGTEVSDGTARGVIHRRWLAVKDALVGLTDEQLIVDAEQEDHRTLTGYDTAVTDILSPTARDIVERQATTIRVAHEQVHSLATR